MRDATIAAIAAEYEHDTGDADEAARLADWLTLHGDSYLINRPALVRVMMRGGFGEALDCRHDDEPEVLAAIVAPHVKSFAAFARRQRAFALAWPCGTSCDQGAAHA